MTVEERAESARYAVLSRWKMRDILADRRRNESRRIIDVSRDKSMSDRLQAAVELTRATTEFSRFAKENLTS